MGPLAGLSRWRPHAQVHFSQEGEDILLQRIFAGQKSGFYVDVGSHHPRRFSNTYWAYRRGWNGINVDARPGSKVVFDRARGRDSNVETCVGETEGTTILYTFAETALNTVGAARSDEVEQATRLSALQVPVPITPLGTILQRLVPSGVDTIDFLSVDVEGSEMQVLRGNDWERFRPRVIVIEILKHSLVDLTDSEEIRYLQERGFVPVAMLFHSVILVSDRDLLKERWGTSN